MLPFITIFGKQYGMYGILGFIGIVVGILFAVFYFTKFYDIKKEDAFYASLFGVIGIGVGAKVLYLITITPTLIRNASTINWKEAIPLLITGGFVFYGGLIGGVLGLLVYAKAFKISFKKLVMIFVPIAPIVHAIARIGCVCSGCCYGKEYHGPGHIVFHHSLYNNNNIPLFPTQIVESMCNLVIFGIIFFTYKKFKGTYKPVALYCVLYGITRFVLEFTRGDEARGILLLSTSQWISIIAVFIGIGLFIYSFKHKEMDESKKIVA